jgi:hypothetical protein
VLSVAPAIGVQELNLFVVQLIHAYVMVGAGSPAVSSADAVSRSPTTGVPAIVGGASIGAVSAAACCGAAIMAIPMIDAAPSRVTVPVRFIPSAFPLAGPVCPTYSGAF